MKNRLFVLLSALCAVIVSGCADPVVFSEVFQLREGQKLYTKHTIWYSDPQNISCLNIQNGTFLPIGTEIEPVETTFFGDNIRFREAATGKEFCIKFNEGYRLCTMRDYIAATFTTSTADELLAKVKPQVRTRIMRGEVVPGMKDSEVLLAYGPPPGVRTPDLRNITWIYWRRDNTTFRLVFRDGIVRNIINLQPGR